jgi:hypothetical protein
MRRRTSLFTSIVAAVAVAVLAGCSDDPADNVGDDSTSPPNTPSSSDTSSSTPPEATETPTSDPTSSDPTEDPNDSGAARAKEAQIPAKHLPGLNDQWFWTREAAGPGPGQDLPSVCQRASLTAIGAVSEYRTDFGSPLDDESYAVQMTGVFPDEQTVATAKQVLKAWQQKCRMHATEDLGLKSVRVGDLQTVATVAGDGAQWLTIYGPAPGGSLDEGWFQAAGFVADGDTLTFLVIANVGQDYNYEDGQQPMDLAVQEAARQLVTSR